MDGVYLPNVQNRSEWEGPPPYCSVPLRSDFVEPPLHRAIRRSFQDDQALRFYRQFFTLPSKIQIQKFLLAKGVTNYSEFLDQVERNEATKLISRPQDLEELAQYWLNHQKLGNRYELVENRVKQRCKERNLDVSESIEVSPKEVYSFLKDVALLSSLSAKSSIKINSSEELNETLDISLLSEPFSESKVNYILGLPVFSAGRYGGSVKNCL